MYKDPIARNLVYVVFGGAILYFGRTLFIPLSYGLFIALLLYPLCQWLEGQRVPRPIAILLSLALLILLVGGMVFLFIRQISALRELWPGLKLKLMGSVTELLTLLERDLQVTPQQGRQWVSQGLERSVGFLFTAVGSILGQSITSLVSLLLVPIYGYLILYYRSPLFRALYLMVPIRLQSEMRNILAESIVSYVSFIKGMLTVYLIVGVLNSLGLYLLGIPHALFFGFIASILTFIPYVGIMIASLFPIAVSWSLYDAVWAPMAVIALYSFVQYLEANLIFPWAVGQRLHLNTLAMLIIIMAGGILWGASGMILFVPFAAIFRLVAQKMEGTEAIILLFGGSK
ncbi:putative PurR-regulated permease PerM [Dyadobacter jejuensis]|uniref:Putative PurR-regulated permease PerM n=1 Tax=Dyadobacter jejuensis TaxID=1082580 RepID=A0A316AFB0_9BACT|nr:AI-2E family transporter [Dyadobacter jejuensis]PWJ55584.1 putative PurR-regulated permease PerM [Dyadobacter jejuensis]